jgi:hypothetical protein
MTDGLLEVRWFGCSRFQNARVKNVVITFSDTTTLYVHPRNDKSHLSSDYERYSRPSAPLRSARYHINLFCAGISILDIQPLIQNKNVQPNHGCELSLNDLPGANPFGLSELNGQTKDNSYCTNGHRSDNNDHSIA